MSIINLLHRKKNNEKVMTNDEKMKLFGFENYEQFSEQLNTDEGFRHFVYDFLKENL